MNQEEQVVALGLEIEAIKSQFAYLNARINLLETRLSQTVPVYDYDNLPNANRTATD